MKRIVFTILILTALSCTREAPRPMEAFLVEFKMPEGCKPAARYGNQRVVFNGSQTYQFETDIAGMVTVSDLTPGIYDIITNWEMSGKEYKALLRDPGPIDDKSRVIVGVSLMNQRIFKAEDLVIDLSAAVVRGLMISKVYYSGTKDLMGRNYGTDSYIEIFNNSDEVAFIDGKYLGLAESVSPAAYPANENPDSIYMRQICRFPGNGSDYPVQPGGSIVIAARSARDHRESAENTVDLSHADFEVKTMEGSGNPDVPMLPIISNSTKIQTLNLISGGPNAVVLFETDEDVLSWPEVYQRGRTSGEMFRRIHRSVVIDGVECLRKPAQTDPDVNTKRLQAEIDAGFITITAVNGNNHESVDRKVTRYENGRYYLSDTNNTSADFVVCTDPTPRKYDKEGMK